MLRIGVLTGGGNHDDLVKQIDPVGSFDWFERADALIGRAVEGKLDIVITGLQDEFGRSIASTLVDLVSHRPSLPVVVHTKLSRGTIGELRAVFALGLRMACCVRPYARLEPVLRYVVSPWFRPPVAPLLLQRLHNSVPAAVALFHALAILEAPMRRSVDELASWSGVSARTIERRLRRLGWPPAHVIIQSFIALDAVWLMTEYGWSARRVQHVRGFPHPSSVTRLLATYAGTRPSTLVDDGGFPAALAHVSRVLRHRAGG